MLQNRNEYFINQFDKLIDFIDSYFKQLLALVLTPSSPMVDAHPKKLISKKFNKLKISVFKMWSAFFCAFKIRYVDFRFFINLMN